MYFPKTKKYKNKLFAIFDEMKLCYTDLYALKNYLLVLFISSVFQIIYIRLVHQML